MRAADFAFDKLRVDMSRAPLRAFDARMLQRLRLRPGDIVLEKSGGGEHLPVGRSVLFNHPDTAVPTNFAARLRPSADVESRYLVYVLRHLYESGATKRAINQTTGIQNLDTASWLQTEAPYPSAEGQRRIADFLDDRVSRIDQIIAARQEQSALLDGVFPSLVTSSIDGVHTTWRRLGGTVRITDGAHVSPELDGGVYNFVSTRDLTSAGTIDFEGSLKTSPTSYESLVRNGCRPVAGDVLFSKDGTVGRVALVQSRREFAVASSLIIISAEGAIQPRYLIHAMRHSFVDHQVKGFVRGAGLPRISLTNLKRVRIPVPTENQQLRIAEDLDRRWNSLHDQRSRFANSVSLLTEYKSSLITAAVTGELDVTTAGSSIPG